MARAGLWQRGIAGNRLIRMLRPPAMPPRPGAGRGEPFDPDVLTARGGAAPGVWPPGTVGSECFNDPGRRSAPGLAVRIRATRALHPPMGG